MARRASGEGSLFYRKDKKLWVAQLTFPDGKKSTKYSKTQKEAKDWLLNQRTALKGGLLVPSNKITVGDCFETWINDVMKFQVRESTFDTQNIIINKHILPAIGHLLLHKLTPSHLQNLLSDKIAQGYSRRTVKYIHTLIKQMLDHARKWNLVGVNVADVVTCPKAEKKPIEPLTQSQISNFLNIIKTDELYPLWVVFISTGLRRGEALGLKWENVNLDKGLIWVKGIITSVKGKTTWGEPKTASSRRIVGLPEYTINILKKHQQSQTVQSDFVFCTSKGTAYSPRNILRKFKQLASLAELPESTTIHSLRHFFVSYALSQNVPIKDVQAIVGHSDFRTTANTYAHLMEDAQTEAAGKINNLFSTPDVQLS